LSSPSPLVRPRALRVRALLAARGWLLVGALLGATGLGCELPPATAVAVSVKTELVVGQELARVNYRVFAVNDDPDGTKPVSEFTAAAENLDKPFVVTRAHQDEFLLSVEGFASGAGEPVVVYRERVTFKTGKTLALHVFLARACYRRACRFDGLTCYGAAYDGTLPGQCEKYPQRELSPVKRPGQESEWEYTPTTATLLDAGLEQDPFHDDGDEYEDDTWSRLDGGRPPSCIGPTGRSCGPDPLVLDGSFAPAQRE
jgi:hypothetical protein